MVNVAMSHFIDLGVNDHQVFSEVFSKDDTSFFRLPWDLDEVILERIQAAKHRSLGYGSSLVLKRTAFSQFGKKALKGLEVNPDTFVQMAIQLAYMRLHGKPAPTYETASTRQYLKGRTETLRSCTKELVTFCEKMDGIHIHRSEKRQALKKAIQTHNRLMNEARQGRGCDRHLFGLASMAQEDGRAMPDLFKDPAFTLSGGHGNFILSTSTCGYTGMSGGTSPMCLDGYGCFYNFEDGCIWLWITAFRQSFETSVEKFHGSLTQAFKDIYQLLLAENSSKL